MIFDRLRTLSDLSPLLIGNNVLPFFFIIASHDHNNE